MGMKILIPLDDSENAMRAAQFVAANWTPDHEVTLFSILLDTPAICDMQSPELTPYFVSQQTTFCMLEEKKRELMREAQTKAKEILIQAGFPAKNVLAKLQVKKRGIARDIVDEAHAGYHIVVMGRRGLSGIGEFLLGSVSQKVLSACKDLSIVLVS